MEWIKVSDRLPDTEGTYLISMTHPLVNHDSVAARWYDFDKKGFYNLHMEIEITDYVTHWAFMPKPPKDE